jgi:hypothetical protein
MQGIASLRQDQNYQESIPEAVQELMKSGFGREASFRLRLRNTGELTIHDLVLQLACISNSGTTVHLNGPGYSGTVDENGCKFRLPTEVQASAGEYRDPPPKIFPGDHIDFPAGDWTIQPPFGRTSDDSSLNLHWKAFLDDAIPCEGAIDLLDDYRQAMRELTRPAEPEENADAGN